MSGDIGPVVVTVDLACAPQAAFDAFVSGFGTWWPVRSHSLSRAAGTRCAFEAVPGGRIFETAPDGATHLWGSVTEIDASRHLRFMWHPGRDPASAQQVEVKFVRTSDGSRVTLTHDGWEKLGEIAPLLRREYVSGWRKVLGEDFTDYVNSTS